MVTVHAGQERRCRGELFGVAPPGMYAAGRSERGAEIAHDIPLLYRAVGVPVRVDGVVRALQIDAVEHHEYHQQSLMGPRTRERILFPVPRGALCEIGTLQAESAARLLSAAERVSQRERRQIVDGRLVIADSGEHPRQYNFDRSLGPARIMRRLLDRPFAPAWIDDRHAGAHSTLLYVLVPRRCRWIGSVRVAPGAMKQILRGNVCGLLPQLLRDLI